MVSPVLPESGWNKHWQKTEIPRLSSPAACVECLFLRHRGHPDSDAGSAVVLLVTVTVCVSLL